MIAIVPYNWTRRQLIVMSGLRTCLIPLLLLCCAPRHQPVIAGEAAAFVFSSALGVTNGLAGSLPMMLAPAKVPATLKEVTGNMMTLSYNVGLTAGSLIGYVFESMLGPQLMNPCPSYPYIAKPPTANTSLFTTMASITSSTTMSTTLLTTAATVATTQATITAAATTTTTAAAAAAAAVASTTMLPAALSTAAALVTTGMSLVIQHTTALPETSTRLFTTMFNRVPEYVTNSTLTFGSGD